jgi:hypothetical protein
MRVGWLKVIGIVSLFLCFVFIGLPMLMKVIVPLITFLLIAIVGMGVLYVVIKILFGKG